MVKKAQEDMYKNFLNEIGGVQSSVENLQAAVTDLNKSLNNFSASVDTLRNQARNSSAAPEPKESKNETSRPGRR